MMVCIHYRQQEQEHGNEIETVKKHKEIIMNFTMKNLFDLSGKTALITVVDS